MIQKHFKDKKISRDFAHKIRYKSFRKYQEEPNKHKKKG